MKKIVFLFALGTVIVGCATAPADARRRAIEEKLDSIVIPEVEFKQADMYCVMDEFRKSSIEYDKDHKGVNIVTMPPSGSEMETHVITFRAKNISLREALNISCEEGKLRWFIEDSVVKVRLLQTK